MRLSVKIALIFGEMCFLEERYEKMKKTFENFESGLYSKSGSMPLK